MKAIFVVSQFLFADGTELSIGNIAHLQPQAVTSVSHCVDVAAARDRKGYGVLRLHSQCWVREYH